MKIGIILGTRPEIIKLAPVVRICESKNLDYFILHTGQHYSINLDRLFFRELELPLPKYNLEVGSGSHGKQTGLMVQKIEEVLEKEKPTIVLVEGDTNTVLAGALAASKLGVEVGHIEAGLRSYDREMPEEINRVLADHVSNILFCPTEFSKKSALKEGISSSKIQVTGNTIVDSVLQNIHLSEQKSRILDRLGLAAGNYFLLTMHRQENVDDKEKLESVFIGLEKLYQIYGVPIIFPIHPRTKERVEKFGLSFPAGLRVVEPVGFLDFLQLEAKARLILTDSGGVQEEACILKAPCLTLRENTERPETLEAGANVLVGTNSIRIVEGAGKMLGKEKNWDNPFGDGKAAERVIGTILNQGKLNL